jgi:hypothetical protein
MRSIRLLAIWLPLVGGTVALIPGCGEKEAPTAPLPGTGPAPAAVSRVNPDAPGFFVDVTEQSGIRLTYHNGEETGYYSILDSLGGGVGLIDYDQDGLLDVYVTGGGKFGPNKEIIGLPCKMYHNEGKLRFRDVTAEVGLDKVLFYSHGVAVGDYDNDGWPDMLVTGYGRLALYHNNKGKFEEVTERAGLLDKRPIHWSTSAAWADFNGDGHLDLYVCHYVDWSFTGNNPKCKDSTGEKQDVCSPKQFNPLPHALFLNNGDGTFKDASAAAGLKPGKGLGVLAVDVNHDGKPDVYVANDTVDNFLYINKGGGKFDEQATELSVARDENGVPNGSMGVDAADYDGSGHFSIFVTNYQHEAHALYRNRGQGPFRFASAPAGITAIGLIYVGFGTGFLDYDLDGNEDIFITNGHVVHYPPPPGSLQQRPVLLRNMRKPGDQPFAVRFENVSDLGGPYFHRRHRGRGVALGDLDNDGKTDLVLSQVNEPIAVVRNPTKHNPHWFGVQVVGQPCRDAVGAELTLEVGGRKLLRQVKGGGSYLSSSDRRIVFGLMNDTKVDRLTVKWPSGKTQTWDGKDLAIDRYWKVVEGQDRLQEPTGAKGS